MVTNEKRLREEIGKMNALSSNGKLVIKVLQWVKA